MDREIWDLLGELGPPPSHSPIPDARTLLERWKETIPPGRVPGRGARHPGALRRRMPVALAATVVFLGGWWLGRTGEMPVAGTGVTTERIAAEAEGPATVQLPDGTVVRVAAGGRLQYTGSARLRDVRLEGRAFFAVARDADRPFRVHGDGGEAYALGTRFDLTSIANALDLVVVEGKVALATSNGRVEVGPGQQSDAREGRVSPPSAVSDIQARLAWMEGVLVFQNTPLDVVAREVGERFGTDVRLSDPVLSERTVTAWFGDQEFDEVIEAVCRAVDARCASEAGRATIAPWGGR